MTQRHVPVGINPVTLEPTPATTKTVYRVAFYDADGKLVGHQQAWPEIDNPTLQMIADISAASRVGLSMQAGTAVVWDDADIDPPTRTPELGGDLVAWREFGPGFGDVPQYRYEVDNDARTIMAFPK